MEFFMKVKSIILSPECDTRNKNIVAYNKTIDYEEIDLRWRLLGIVSQILN